jgi:hypothetical protein
MCSVLQIPKINPLVDFAHFAQFQELVSQFLVTGNAQALDAALLEKAATIPKRHIMGALLLASFHEVFLLSILPRDSTEGLRQRRAEYDSWLLRSTALGEIFNASERQIFIQFASGTAGRSTAANNSSSLGASSSSSGVDPLSFFALSSDSSSDAVLRLRVAAHVVAVALAASDDHPYAFLRSLLLNPLKTKDGFFPTMEEDALKMAQNALGGRWYRCPNQHPYYVDLCGRPTVINKCSQCGAQIGGENHDLLGDNVDIGNVGTGYHQKTVVEDASEKNYCLRDAAQEAQDKFYSVRALEPREVRAIRVLMHMCMLAGSVVLGQSWRAGMDPVFNRSFSNPGEQTSEFLHNHVLSDWNLLCTMLTKTSDDVSLIFHLFLLNSTGKYAASRDSPSGEEGVRIVPDRTKGLSALSSTTQRDEWENWFSKPFKPFANQDSLTKLLSEAQNKYSSGDDDSAGPFMVELLEKVDLNTISAVTRKDSVPALFSYTRRFDFTHFQFTLGMVRNVREKFPVLLTFVESEPTYRSLRHLPKVFEWFALLKTKFNGHLDREVARNKSCGAIIEEVDEADRARWMTAFIAFADAWNSSWPYVKKYGCLQFSDEFNNFRMDLDAPVSFCLPNELDEGLCPTALTQYLVNKHNNLVQLADEALLLRVKRSRQETSRAKAISSRFLTAAHCFNYNLSDFISFLEKQCVSTDGGSGTAGYNFAKAEARLIERYLTALPAIDLEQSGFVYAHEQQGTLTTLRQKLRQEALPADIITAIKKDFTSPAQSQRMLDTLEVVIDFLGATGGSMVATLDNNLREMLLTKYIKTVLLVDDEIESRVVAQQVWIFIQRTYIWYSVVPCLICCQCRFV